MAAGVVVPEGIRVELAAHHGSDPLADSVVENSLAALLVDMFSREERLLQVAHRSGVGVDELLGLLESAASPTDSSFTVAELTALERAGIEVAADDRDPSGVLSVLAGRTAEHQLIAEGLSVDQAAALLRVTPTRVRQRIANGDIVSLRFTDGHLMPAWQFPHGQLVPGLAVLTPHTADLHPLALAGFMTRPNVDLTIDRKPVSPVQWLITGGDGGLVEELLTAITYA